MRVLVIDRPNEPHANAGQVLDLPDTEATVMMKRGSAVAVPDEPPVELPSAPPPEPAPEVTADEEIVEHLVKPQTRKARTQSRR